MAQIRTLKIHTTGIPVEHALTDDVTFASFTVNGGGPVLSATGLDMNNTDVSDVQDIVFVAPTTATINQTAGNLIIDDIMAKERNNVMTVAGAVLFPLVTDTAGQLDSFKLPNIAGVPSATPAFSSDAGYLVYDSTNKNLYAWDGAAWDNLNTVTSAANIDETNWVAAVGGVSARDALYISGADEVGKADCDSDATANLIGFATAAASAAAAVTVRRFGQLGGFSSLTPGARQYLSATAGAITETLPVGTGNVIVQAGYAKNATTLEIAIEFLGRRAS